jgi:hypothetical protein
MTHFSAFLRENERCVSAPFCVREDYKDTFQWNHGTLADCLLEIPVFIFYSNLLMVSTSSDVVERDPEMRDTLRARYLLLVEEHQKFIRANTGRANLICQSYAIVNSVPILQVDDDSDDKVAQAIRLVDSAIEEMSHISEINTSPEAFVKRGEKLLLDKRIEQIKREFETVIW